MGENFAPLGENLAPVGGTSEGNLDYGKGSADHRKGWSELLTDKLCGCYAPLGGSSTPLQLNLAEETPTTARDTYSDPRKGW